MNKIIIKNLPKIVSNWSRLIFTAFFLMGVVCGSSAFASSDELRARLLEEGAGGVGDAVINVMHSVNADGGSGAPRDLPLSPLKQRSPVSFRLDTTSGEGDESLYIPTNISLADGEMDKIIECLGYVGGEYKEVVAEKYPHMQGPQLQEYLVRNAWIAATEGHLGKIVSALSEREGELQAKCKKLTRDIKKLTAERDELLRSWGTALQTPDIAETPKLQTTTFELINEGIASRATIKNLKIALGSVVTVSTVGFITMLTFWVT